MSDSEKLSYTLQVNGNTCQIENEWYFESLLNVLRDRLGLTGAKYSCDGGQCGACTVYVGDKAVNACIELAADAVGYEITTIEGATELDSTAELIQNELAGGGDVQCGYCMPGMVMNATNFLRSCPAPSEPEIREAICGNQCRCTGYSQIVAAIERAAEAKKS